MLFLKIGENLPYGKYKTAQHFSALNLLKRIFEESNENESGNRILYAKINCFTVFKSKLK